MTQLSQAIILLSALTPEAMRAVANWENVCGLLVVVSCRIHAPKQAKKVAQNISKQAKEAALKLVVYYFEEICER